MMTKPISLYLFNLCLLICCFVAFTENALAYVGPGIAAVLLQLIVGGIAGIAMTIKLYWRRLIKRNKNAPPTEKPKKADPRDGE